MPRHRSRQDGWVGQVEFFLNHLVTRVILSSIIILSLVPHEWMHANDEMFLLVFLPEFLLRAVLAFRTERIEGRDDPASEAWGIPRGTDAALLLLDLVALLSFLPWAARTTRWLRIFRLSRTIMLLRYWAPLVSDMWIVLRRRERARQLTLMFAAVGLMAFAGAVFLNHASDEAGEDFDGDGNVGDTHDHVFWVRMYWALRQIEDPGNMLQSPHETGTLIVSIALTFFGLFLVSFLIGVGTDAVGEVMELSQMRSAGLKGHTVLLNLTSRTRALLDEVVGEYQKLIPTGTKLFSPRGIREFRKRAKQQREFVVVGSDAEPPDFLLEPELARIIYREHSDEDDEAFLTRADVPLARRVVLLADIDSDAPDDETVRTLITIVERLREVLDDDPEARTNLIAEIVDESNIGAAQKAIARASGRVDARIVPTERLLALFAFSVARRRRSADLFLSILSSAGYELYSYDYRRSDTPKTPGRVPALPTDPSEALLDMHRRGISRAPARRVIPIGAMMSVPGTGGRDPATVSLNPGGGFDPASAERMSGFIALAPNLRVTSDFADEILERPQAAAPAVPTTAAALPPLQRDGVNPLRRVLVCGFRPATVNLIEAVLTAEPRGEVLVLVESAEAKIEAVDALNGHSNLVRTGLLQGLRGTFESIEGTTDEFRCIPGNGTGSAVGRVVVEVGDWTSSRLLMRLPRDFGVAPQMDAIFLVSSQRQGSDATTATALMKLEHLQDHHDSQTGTESHASSQTIVAEVVNADLAHRLDRRYHAMGRDNVSVFSLHEVRAFFMFQSIMVPEFTTVFAELLSPWGQSFTRLSAQGGQGRISFSELAVRLRSDGRVLVAVEVTDTHGDDVLYVGHGDPEDDDHIDLSRLQGVWIIQADPSGSGTSRYPTVDELTAQSQPTAEARLEEALEGDAEVDIVFGGESELVAGQNLERRDEAPLARETLPVVPASVPIPAPAAPAAPNAGGTVVARAPTRPKTMTVPVPALRRPPPITKPPQES